MAPGAFLGAALAAGIRFGVALAAGTRSGPPLPSPSPANPAASSSSGSAALALLADPVAAAASVRPQTAEAASAAASWAASSSTECGASAAAASGFILAARARAEGPPCRAVVVTAGVRLSGRAELGYGAGEEGRGRRDECPAVAAGVSLEQRGYESETRGHGGDATTSARVCTATIPALGALADYKRRACSSSFHSD